MSRPTPPPLPGKIDHHHIDNHLHTTTKILRIQKISESISKKSLIALFLSCSAIVFCTCSSFLVFLSSFLLSSWFHRNMMSSQMGAWFWLSQHLVDQVEMIDKPHKNCWNPKQPPWDVRNPVNNGINNQSQLVFSPDFFTINSITVWLKVCLDALGYTEGYQQPRLCGRCHTSSRLCCDVATECREPGKDFGSHGFYKLKDFLFGATLQFIFWVVVLTLCRYRWWRFFNMIAVND